MTVKYTINGKVVDCYEEFYSQLSEESALRGALVKEQRLCDNLKKLDIGVHNCLSKALRIDQSYQCSFANKHNLSLENCINCDDHTLNEMAISLEYSVKTLISLKDLVVSRDYTIYKAKELSSSVIHSLKALEADYLELNTETVKDVFDEHLNKKSFTAWFFELTTFGFFHISDNAITDLLGEINYFQNTLYSLCRDLDN